MAAQHLRTHNPSGTLVIEALDRVAALTIRQRVLERALDIAGLDEIPEAVEALTFFASGPLYEEAARALGSDFADELLNEIAPALDHAWDRDRASELHGDDGDLQSGEGPTGDAATGAASRHRAGEDRVASQVTDRSELDEDNTPRVGTLPPIEAVHAYRGAMKRSTIQRVPPRGDELFDAGSGVVDTSRELPDLAPVSDPTPTSQRFTMPYLSSVLTPPAPGRRVLLLHGDDERRLALSALLERDGYAVIAAPNREVARALFERMAPRVVVADVETLAPDYEPLRPVLDELFGLASPSLVLLSDGRPRELPAAIVSVIEPAAQPVDDAVASAVSAALAPAAQAGL